MRATSLRRLLTLGTASISAIALGIIVGLALLFAYVRREFEGNLLMSVVEQRAADDIVTSVYGQLLEAYRQVQTPTRNLARFDSLGAIVYDRYTAYLYKPMDMGSRLQVEEIKALHRALEVDARAALDLARSSDPVVRARYLRAMDERAALLERAMDGLVALRERERAAAHEARTAALTRWVVALGFLVAGLAIFALYFGRTVRKQVAAPLAQLSDAARQLGTGDMSTRVPPQRHEELAAVANSFNEMAERIREATRARESSEARYRRLFNEAPIPLYRTSPNGIMLDANPALVELLGYSSVTDVIGEQVEPWYVQQKDRDAFTTTIAQRGISRDQMIELRKKNGERIWVVDTTRRVVDPESGDVSYEGGLVDLTDRRRMEDALRERDERFSEMAEHINEAFYIMDVTTSKALYVSPTWAQIWGRPLQEAYDPTIWFGAVHPEDRVAMMASQGKVKAGIIDDIVFRVVRPDNSVRWVRGRSFPVRGAGGSVDRVVGVAEDITELRQAEERFTQAQKMEAVGRLAGGVAHDFNNLLTVIISEADMIRSDLPAESPHQESLTELRRASDSAVALTQQLLAFSRKQFVEPVVFSLNATVSETGSMLRRLIGEDVRLEIRLGTDAKVRADRGQIQQVLTNLAVNARDAMPTGGALVLETSVVTVSEEDARAHQDLAVGEFVLLTVSDTGMGMSEDVRARAFEPFFTTKEHGKGTGLGLATSHGIIKQAGGFINIYSELKVGTTFRIYLPRVHEPTVSRPTPASVEAPRGTETILMVEDEEAVRRVGARILRRQGYQVIEARDGDEALRLLGEFDGMVHMLFTDVVLPGMGGRQLAERVKLMRPDIVVLFTSGYTDDIILQHKLAAQDVMIVQKPYSWIGLAQKVRFALDSKT